MITSEIASKDAEIGVDAIVTGRLLDAKNTNNGLAAIIILTSSSASLSKSRLFKTYIWSQVNVPVHKYF